ncbi:MAG: superoxide dismutase [Cu-Zn] SodC [Ferrovibrio sp.]|uniref:superoxide dismutase [Cu-Zn] SodC n=1 Tax=Ferrovibrio sp. TaxID=1917215 RepID=UPI0026018B2A|nr:superoxide dismutase [Cu-Zn] SodC [Ferrovibrio sp.]MCW0235994.1 superoxide dismutase [Cu-Zn] SodC [Ferrovibrio sp.]
MQRILLTTALSGFLVLTSPALLAAEKSIPISEISANGVGMALGIIVAKDTPQGLLLTPDLKQVGTPGPHGFHLHEKGSCGTGPGPDGRPAAGMAAGGHYDPQKTGRHHGPHAMGGHRGDLPPLVVNGDGTATLPVIAPHLKVSDLAGKALMIHAGGDNYSDMPAPLGGGGPRIACGVIK